jgi:5'-3' exonuclease
MGVKGLFQFLKRFEKEVSIQSYLAQKRVAVDIFWFLYQARGDMFKFQSYLSQVLKVAKEVYCVFDGRPSREKIEILREQANKRKELEQTIQGIDDFLRYPFHKITSRERNELTAYLNQLRRQAWTPSPEHIEYVKQWLSTKQNVILWQAKEEADDVLIELQQQNKADVIITNDSDLLTLGAENVIRMKSPTIGKLYCKHYLQDKLQFSDKQWQEFMLLCRHMPIKDIILAYSLISVYKDLEYGLQKYYIHNKNDLLGNSSIDYIEIEIDY